MQTPDQPHEEKPYIEQSSGPHYELDAHAPSEEAIRQGLVYPPPPSFYQNVPISVEPPPLPATPISPVPAYAVNGPPSYIPPTPAVKKSKRWVWILVSICSIILLISCSLCGWRTYTIFSTAYQQATNSLTLVDDYYTAIHAKNYVAAYNDLAPQGTINGLTLDQFTQRTQALDEQYGSVLSYTLGQPQYVIVSNNGSPNISSLSIPVNVSRSKLTYTALLTVIKVGRSWKISDFDRI
jgi:hypothetical protein